MNILPFIFTFLILLSFGSYALLQQRLATTFESKSYRGYMRAERLVRNRTQSKLYYRKKSIDQKETSEKTEPKDFENPRTIFPPSESSRFNLYSLFHDNPSPLLYEAAVKLLNILYQHTPFFKKDLAYRMVDAWIEKGHGKKECAWVDLFPDDPPLREIFYKMLKGTNHYDRSSHPLVGYPPLEDFFHLNHDKNKAVCFPFASEPILSAFFEEKVVLAILDKETLKAQKDRKKYFLDQTELQVLLKDKSPQITELFNWDTRRSPNEYIKEIDPKTQITCRKKILK
jgi:hypothetical protein